MKILVLSESSSPSRYWEAALPLLRSRGIDASFASLRMRGKLTENLEKAGVSVLALRSKRSIDYPLTVLRLVKILRDGGFDIIHASEAIQASIAGIACLFAKNAKCVFHYHHSSVTGKQRLCSTLGSKLADMIMAVSESARLAAVHSDGTPIEKTFVAYNGIEMLRQVSGNEIEDLRRKLEIPENARIIAIVARLNKIKGHETLYGACKIVASQIAEPLHLIVVGDGIDKDSLMEKGASAEGFITHFVGFQDDVALWFSSADVVAMPSYHEPFGLAAIEAMACGKPLVASNVEGLAEIIQNEKTGILVPPRDETALADAFIRILESPDLGRKLGENARRHVGAEFTMEKMVSGWIDCYEAVLSQSTP